MGTNSLKAKAIEGLNEIIELLAPKHPELAEYIEIYGPKLAETAFYNVMKFRRARQIDLVNRINHISNLLGLKPLEDEIPLSLDYPQMLDLDIKIDIFRSSIEEICRSKKAGKDVVEEVINFQTSFEEYRGFTEVREEEYFVSHATGLANILLDPATQSKLQNFTFADYFSLTKHLLDIIPDFYNSFVIRRMNLPVANVYESFSKGVVEIASTVINGIWYKSGNSKFKTKAREYIGLSAKLLEEITDSDLKGDIVLYSNVSPKTEKAIGKISQLNGLLTSLYDNVFGEMLVFAPKQNLSHSKFKKAIYERLTVSTWALEKIYSMANSGGKRADEIIDAVTLLNECTGKSFAMYSDSVEFSERLLNAYLNSPIHISNASELLKSYHNSFGDLRNKAVANASNHNPLMYFKDLVSTAISLGKIDQETINVCKLISESRWLGADDPAEAANPYYRRIISETKKKIELRRKFFNLCSEPGAIDLSDDIYSFSTASTKGYDDATHDSSYIVCNYESICLDNIISNSPNFVPKAQKRTIRATLLGGGSAKPELKLFQDIVQEYITANNVNPEELNLIVNTIDLSPGMNDFFSIKSKSIKVVYMDKEYSLNISFSAVHGDFINDDVWAKTEDAHSVSNHEDIVDYIFSLGSTISNLSESQKISLAENIRRFYAKKSDKLKQHADPDVHTVISVATYPHENIPEEFFSQYTSAAHVNFVTYPLEVLEIKRSAYSYETISIKPGERLPKKLKGTGIDENIFTFGFVSTFKKDFEYSAYDYEKGETKTALVKAGKPVYLLKSERPSSDQIYSFFLEQMNGISTIEMTCLGSDNQVTNYRPGNKDAKYCVAIMDSCTPISSRVSLLENSRRN